MTMVYRSKTDAWLLALFAFAIAASLYGAMVVLASGTAAAWPTAAVIAGVGVFLPLWILFTTRYTLQPHQLLVQSGPFSWRIRMADISAVTPTSSAVSSPALSLDRLRIDYGRGRSVLISPRDQAQFLRAIEAKRRTAD